MTEQDQARIAAIEKDLNTLINVLKDEMGTNDGVSRFGIKWDRFSPPIAPVEEYVECVAWQGVLSQTEWKEGEWAWSSKHKTFLGIIDDIDLSQTLTVCLDNQNGNKERFGITEYLVKPTPEEIQSHLTKIAEQRYPIGTKYRAKYQQEAEHRVITNDGFKYRSNRWSYDHDKEIQYLDNNGLVVWDNIDGWASIIEPIKEERWKVSVQPFKYNRNDNRITIYVNDGNLTIHEAHKISDKIKQLLKEL